MKNIFTIVLILISFSVLAQERYIDNDFDLQFSYPKADTVDRYDKNRKFNKTIFMYGIRPDSKSVQLIFESSSNTIKKFITSSREERKKGGYEHEVSEQKYLLKNGREGVLITRDMKTRKNIMHYFVFSPVPDVLLSLYFVGDTDRFGENSKAQGRAKEAYKTIISSLAK